ncbi:IS607 family transposase [Methanotorris formicicus]
MEMYRVGKFAKLVGVHPQTVKRWIYSKKIRAIKIGKEYRIPHSELQKILGDRGGNRIAIYARVSGRDQKNDLERQLEYLKNYCKEKNYAIEEIITDIGRGLNENRRGLKKLFKLVKEGKINKVIITTEDRLTRFGFKYLKEFFNHCGVEIEVVDKKNFKTPHEELVDDLITIISHFAGKLYGFRSHKRKKIIKQTKKLFSE